MNLLDRFRKKDKQSNSTYTKLKESICVKTEITDYTSTKLCPFCKEENSKSKVFPLPFSIFCEKRPQEITNFYDEEGCIHRHFPILYPDFWICSKIHVWKEESKNVGCLLCDKDNNITITRLEIIEAQCGIYCEKDIIEGRNGEGWGNL